tara:strand:- start:707 stop:1261 length:555 start_codon:yes stop_codon:yes gene_type:complete
MTDLPNTFTKNKFTKNKKNPNYLYCKNDVFILIVFFIVMQVERVKICSRQMLNRGITWSRFVPIEQEVSIQDILKLFARFILEGAAPPNDILHTCFRVLLEHEEECLFVFMRRGEQVAAGILRSNKPLCSVREQELLTTMGQQRQWNIPLWTWTESDPHLLESMEHQCRQQALNGPCMGVWCYR